MEFQDKLLTCTDCGDDFVFTAGEQLFFREKQFKNPPKRCKTCKVLRTAEWCPGELGACSLSSFVLPFESQPPLFVRMQ